MPDKAFSLLRNVPSHAVDSGVFVLEIAEDKSRAVQLDFTPIMEILKCCLRDVILKIERDLRNSTYDTSISGVKFSWTTLYRGTLSEVYNGKESPLVGFDGGEIQLLTKNPFVWRRRSDFGGRTFRAISR